MTRILVDLMQYTGFKGGMETYIRELYRELGRRDDGREYVGLASRELAAGDHSWFPGEVVDSRLSGENRLSWAYGELISVGRAARRLRADLVHGPSMFGPLRSAAPVVITIHDLLYFSHPELMTTSLYTEPVKWMERRGAATATCLIASSAFTAAAIERYLPRHAAKTTVVPLAPTTPVRAGGGEREPALFLAVGQRRPHKNFPTILRAMALIPEARRPRLVITGSYGEDPLRPLVAELGLDRWVELVQWVDRDELDGLFARATALIDVSFATGFGLPTLEAMAGGLPVVLADVPNFREVAGAAARYVDPRDDRALASALVELVASPALRSDLAERGSRRAAEFSWAQTADQTLAVFDRALATGAHR